MRVKPPLSTFVVNSTVGILNVCVGYGQPIIIPFIFRVVLSSIDYNCIRGGTLWVVQKLRHAILVHLLHTQTTLAMPFYASFIIVGHADPPPSSMTPFMDDL